MKNYNQIKKLKVSTEKYVGKGYTLLIDFETGAIDWADDTLFYQKPRKIKTLSELEIKQLLKNLKKTELLDWQGKYYDLETLDGEIWGVVITFDTDSRKITGSAIHPAPWDNFCRLLSEVSDKVLN